MSERWIGPVGFDAVFDGNHRPQDIGVENITLLTPRGQEGRFPTINDLDAALLWTKEHFGKSMIELTFGDNDADYYIYPDRTWYNIGQNFYFTNSDQAFAFKMRWC